MRALIIDDSRPIRLTLRTILADLGFDVLEAGHGLQALDHLETGDVPDVCLVDWNMPVMDGYSFVYAVRANPAWHHVALMMVTMESESSRIVRALAAGADEYVVKPFTAEVIEEKLRLLGLVGHPVAV